MISTAGGSAQDLAIAGFGELAAVFLDDAQSGALAEGADVGRGVGGEAWHSSSIAGEELGKVGMNRSGGVGIQLPCVEIHDKLTEVPECTLNRGMLVTR